MFAARLVSLRHELSVIRNCVAANEGLRRLVRSAAGAHATPSPISPFEEEARKFPSGIDWRIFDHCSAVMRLYAIYERFASDVLESWLSTLPSLFTEYEALPTAVQKQHRDGIATMLPQIGEGRFGHLNIADVIRQLSECLSGNKPYALVSEAFLIRDRNLRSQELEVLFARAGVPQCWSWMQHHKRTKAFVHDVLGSAETAESELGTFIEYRNEAAHGDVSDVLDFHGLLRLCDFVDVLCEALAERVQSAVLAAQLEAKVYHEIGESSESYPRNNVVVVPVERGDLRVGDELTVAGRRYCFTAKILELQLNGIPHPAVFVHGFTEVGIRFDRPVRKFARLYQNRVPSGPDNTQTYALALR